MNESLSKLGRQLLTIWKQLGLNQRISIALTGALVIGGLLGLAAWSGRGSYSLLYGRLDEGEAAKVIAALDEAKVRYQVRAGGAIQVPSDQVHQVRMQLAGKGIPRGEGVGFEIFDKPNFGVSDFVQRANYTRAIQGELARTISQLDQVDAARVMIVLPENRLLIGNQQKPTASVFVRVRGAGPLPPAAVSSIRLLVANAVEGLPVQSVSVVDNLGNVLSDNEDDSIAGLSNNQLTARKNLEQYLARKAEGMLEKVLGQGQAVVRVSADINWDSITRYEERYDPDGQVIRISTVEDESVESTSPSSGGAAGMTANSEFDLEPSAPAAPASPTSRTKRKTTNNQYEINRTVSSMTQGAGSLEGLSAAVFVAQQFEGAGTERRAVPRSPEDLQKLRRIVQSALGISDADPDRPHAITLEEMPFNDRPVIELATQLDRQESWRQGLELGQQLILPALGLGALLLFRRALRRTRPEDLTFGLPVPSANGSGNGRLVPGLGRNGNGANGHHEDGAKIVTVEVLNQLIRENPASVTQAVRSWMNRGNPAK